MQHLMTADDVMTSNPGRFHLELSTVRPGVYRVEASYGGSVAQLIEELSASYADKGVAYGIFKALENALAAPGATIATARRAVCRHLDGQLAFLLDNPSIQATNAGAYLQMVKGMFESPEDTAWADELAADMVAFHRALAGTKPEATGLAALKPTATRQVRMTLGGAQNADLSPAQRDAIAVAQANGGTVLRSKDHPLPVLRALVRKRLADYNFQPGTSRRIPVSVTLTARGWSTAVAS